MSAHTASQKLEFMPVATWVEIVTPISVSGSWETGGTQAGIAFGDDSDISIDGELALTAWASSGDFIPVRYTTTVDADTQITFVGILTRRERTLTRMTFRADGMKVRIAATKTYSPMISRRPLFTRTTVSSADDPAGGGWNAGLGNYMLWQAGGRPYEQAASYPSAVFYYSCDHAILAPDWSWTAGEDSWAEGLRLAQASAGQLYQDSDGVVRYRQILGYGGGTIGETLTESSYQTLSQAIEPDLLRADTFTCQFLPRRRLGMQTVADDTTPRHVEPGETITIVLEPENPLVTLETTGGLLAETALVVAQQDGTRLDQATGYTHTVDFKAARTTITVTNDSDWPAIVYRVVLRGEPVVAAEAGSASAGSGVVERVLEQSVYIQTGDDAQRAVDMALAFYGNARAVVSVDGVVHNPSRALGDTVGLTCAAWSMSNQAHVILSVSQSQGRKASMTLADVSDLPNESEFFVVGTTYSGSDVRYLGW